MYESPEPEGSAQGESKAREDGRLTPRSFNLSIVIKAKLPPAESPPIAICSGEYPKSFIKDSYVFTPSSSWAGYLFSGPNL